MAPSPLRSTWLCAGALLAMGTLLAGAAQLYPVRVEVSVCNQSKDFLLKDVGVAIVSGEPETPLHGLGSLGPGECRTTKLEPASEGSVRLVYSASGTRHEEKQAYLERGEHAWLMVLRPGEVSKDVDSAGPLHPPFIFMVLAALCFPAGAVYTFLGCVMALEARLRQLASKVS